MGHWSFGVQIQEGGRGGGDKAGEIISRAKALGLARTYHCRDDEERRRHGVVDGPTKASLEKEPWKQSQSNHGYDRCAPR